MGIEVRYTKQILESRPEYAGDEENSVPTGRTIKVVLDSQDHTSFISDHNDLFRLSGKIRDGEKIISIGGIGLETPTATETLRIIEPELDEAGKEVWNEFDAQNVELVEGVLFESSISTRQRNPLTGMENEVVYSVSAKRTPDSNS